MAQMKGNMTLIMLMESNMALMKGNMAITKGSRVPRNVTKS